MTLAKALERLAKQYLTSENSWYSWRPIALKTLPVGIRLPEGNQFRKNVALKRRLSTRWQEADESERYTLANFYVSEWGGIRNNSEDTLRFYCSARPKDLINAGTHGISSWSKVLCIRNPRSYAIYDARVAVALNALQITSGVKRPRIYPLLKGQNDLINQAAHYVSQKTQRHGWQELAALEFYRRYLALLDCAARSVKLSKNRRMTLEMLLFARAEDLAKLL